MANNKFEFKDNSTQDSDFELNSFDDYESKIGKNVTPGTAQNSGKQRVPVEFLKGVGSDAFRSSSASILPSLGKRIDQEMPNTVRLLGETGQFVSDAKYLKDQFLKDVQPTINQLKRTGQQLGPRVKPFLPKFAQKLYDKITSVDTERVNARIFKEKAKEMQIGGAIGEIFGKQLDQQKELAAKETADRKEDTLIDRQIGESRHKQSYQELARIRVTSEWNANYIKSIQIPYYKKSLELKYRHLFVAQDTFASVTTLAKTTEKQLEAIRHNTALPDFQKVHKTELFKQETMSRVNTYFHDVLGRFRDRVLTPVKEGLESAAQAGSMLGDAASMTDEMGGAPQSRAGFLGSAAGKGLGYLLGTKVGGKAADVLFGKFGGKGLVGRKAKSLDDYVKYGKQNLMLSAQDFAESNEGTLLGNVADILSGSLSRTAGTSANVFSKDPMGASPFTNQAHMALTQVIPGLLSKQLQQLQQMATGKKQEELVFDYDSGDFLKESSYQQKVITEGFGSKASRGRSMAMAVSKFRGAYKAATGTEDLSGFDSIEEDLRTFIANSGIAKMKLRPELIKQVAEGIESKEADDLEIDYTGEVVFKLNDSRTWVKSLGIKDMSFETYVNRTMKGVKKPGDLCVYLSHMLFTKDGVLNKDVFVSLSSAIYEFMADAYKDVLQKHISTYGYARHLKPMIASSAAGGFRHNETTIRNIFTDIDTEEYESSKGFYTEASQNAITEAMKSSKEDIKDVKDEFKQMLMDTWVIKQLMKSETGKKLVPDLLTGIDDLGKSKFDQNIDTFLQDKRSIFDKVADKIPSKLKEKYTTFVAPKVSAKLEDWHKKLIKQTSPVKAIPDEVQRRLDDMEALDPYRNQDEEDQFGTGGFASRPVSEIQVSRARGKGGKVDVRLPSQMTVLVKNIEDLAKAITDRYKALYTDTTPLPVTITRAVNGQSALAGEGDTVSAVKHFEDTFVAYTKEQQEVRKLFEGMGSALAGVGDRLDAIIGNTTGIFTKIWRKVPFKRAGKAVVTFPFKLTGSIAKGLWNRKGDIWHYGAEVPYGIGKWGAGKIWGGTKWGADKLWGGTKWGSDKLWQTTKWTGKKTKDLTLGTYDTLKNLTPDVNALISRGAGNVANKYTKVKDLFKSVGKEKRGRLKFVDIYKKDQVEIGKPLLSAKQQQDGAYFADGNPVKTTFEINKPVFDSNSNVLITEMDIKDGLVTAENKPIIGGGLIKKTIKGTGGLIGSTFKGIKSFFTGGNPIMNLYAQMLGFGGKLVGAAGTGILNGVRRFFGGGSLTKADLKEVVGDKLDVIIALLKDRQKDTIPGKTALESGGTALSDVDKDGDVDTAMEARATRAKEKKEKEAETTAKSVPTLLKDIRDSLTKKKDEAGKGWLGKLFDFLKGKFVTALGGLAGMLGLKGLWTKLKDTLKGFGNYLLKPITSRLSLIPTAIKGVLAWLKAKFVKDSLSGNDGIDLPDIDSKEKRRGGRGSRRRGGESIRAGRGALREAGGTAGKNALSRLFSLQGLKLAGKTAIKGVAGAGLGALTGGAATAYAAGSVTNDVIDFFGDDLHGLVGAGYGEKLKAVSTQDSTLGSLTDSFTLKSLRLLGEGLYYKGVHHFGGDTTLVDEARAKAYGINLSGSTSGLFGSSHLANMLNLESEVYMLLKNGKRANDLDIASWAESFNFDASDKKAVAYWHTWYQRRFAPVFAAFMGCCRQDFNIEYYDAREQSEERQREIIAKFQTRVQKLIATPNARALFETLEPSPEAYKRAESKTTTQSKADAYAAMSEKIQQAQKNEATDEANANKALVSMDTSTAASALGGTQTALGRNLLAAKEKGGGEGPAVTSAKDVTGAQAAADANADKLKAFTETVGNVEAASALGGTQTALGRNLLRYGGKDKGISLSGVGDTGRGLPGYGGQATPYNGPIPQGSAPARQGKEAVKFQNQSGAGDLYGTRAIWQKTKNVGNIRDPNGYKGYKVFSTFTEGIQEWRRLMLRRYFAKGLTSLQAIIPVYAPPSENNTAKYIAYVAKAMGIDPSQNIDPNNVDLLAKMASAMIFTETSHRFSVEEIKACWAADPAFGGSSASQQSNPYGETIDAAGRTLPGDGIPNGPTGGAGASGTTGVGGPADTQGGAQAGDNTPPSGIVGKYINVMRQNAQGAKYSQKDRLGNKTYDCSSFVLRSLKDSGLNVNPGGTTSTMRRDLEKAGFKWHQQPIGADTSMLKPGDILLSPGNHTEVYTGNNQTVGAHSTNSGVSERAHYPGYNYSGFLRLEGAPQLGGGDTTDTGTFAGGGTGTEEVMASQEGTPTVTDTNAQANTPLIDTNTATAASAMGAGSDATAIPMSTGSAVAQVNANTSAAAPVGNTPTGAPVQPQTPAPSAVDLTSLTTILSNSLTTQEKMVSLLERIAESFGTMGGSSSGGGVSNPTTEDYGTMTKAPLPAVSNAKARRQSQAA